MQRRLHLVAAVPWHAAPSAAVQAALRPPAGCCNTEVSKQVICEWFGSLPMHIVRVEMTAVKVS